MLRNQNTAADVNNGNRIDADRAGNVLGHVARTFTSLIPDSSGKRRGAYCPSEDKRPEQKGITPTPDMQTWQQGSGGEMSAVLLEGSATSVVNCPEETATGNATAAIWARLIISRALSS